MAKSQYLVSLQEAVRSLDALRMDPEKPQDVSLSQYVGARWNVSMEAFYADLGINLATDTINNIVNMPDPEMRWALPEIYRDSVRLGMRRAAIYSNLIAATQNVKGLTVTQPFINMSDAMPKYTGIAETIRVGDVSIGQKTVSLKKFARGIVLPYEVRNFVAINVVSIFLQDYGIKMAQGKDMLFLNVATNGDQADGSAAAAVIGVKTPGTLAYRDLLTIYMRMGILGKNPDSMVAGEEMAIDILDMDEFKKREFGTPQEKLNVKTPLPTKSDLYLHPGVAEDQTLIIDPSLAIIEYNAQALLVESEKIVSNQTEATYASFICGFGNAYDDARVILDKSLDIATNGFPAYMDYADVLNEPFTK